MKRGICLTAVGDKASEGVTEDKNSMTDKRAHEGLERKMWMKFEINVRKIEKKTGHS